MLQQGIKVAEQHIEKKYPNGILAGLSSPSPSVQLPVIAPTPTPRPDMTPDAGAAAGATPPQSSGGLISGLASLFGFADGGVIKGTLPAGLFATGPYVEAKALR